MRATNQPSKPLVKRARASDKPLWLATCVAVPLLTVLTACSSSSDDSKLSAGGSNAAGATGPTVLRVPPDDGSGGTGSATGDAGTVAPYMLPAGFTKAQLGGFKLGPALTASTATGGSGGDSSTGCGTQILGVVRDFKGNNEAGGHPDFEHFSGKDASLGIVKVDLGSDQKPVYSADGPFIDTSVNGDAANGQQTTSKMFFDEWYRNTTGVNEPYLVYFYFEPNGAVLTFQSTAFFPLDGAGFGNGPNKHNFGFTTEVHTRFNYKGGETFAFTGDDDLWVFINHKLAIDLGGLHPQASKSIALDSVAKDLGISTGNAYDLDLFHAERHTDASDFRVDTNLEFTNCGTVVSDNPK